jgi:hypothetical protein
MSGRIGAGPELSAMERREDRGHHRCAQRIGLSFLGRGRASTPTTSGTTLRGSPRVVAAATAPGAPTRRRRARVSATTEEVTVDDEAL